jgi:citrate lyase beta subunit
MSRSGSSLSAEFVAAGIRKLREAQIAHARLRPGPSERRQPVHTVYGGAHLFRADTAARLGALARRAMEEYAPDPAALAEAVGIGDAALAASVFERVREKLAREPVEDFRIDFEDGYGTRPDPEEDGHAVAAANAVAEGRAAGTLPPFVGIRLKSLSAELAGRSLRTLDLFVTALLEATGGVLPPNFVVTLPKLFGPEPVRLLAAALAELESRRSLPEGTLRLEIMVETPESIFSTAGAVALPELVTAAGGRCVAAHFGTYDYTASLGITAEHQQMAHPGCDFAKHVMQVALAGSGVWISDGATNVLPVPPHRVSDGAALRAADLAENRAVVHAAWRLHAAHVRHSLEQAFYQGWDLHPAQLVSRYATVYAFFLAGVDAASERLRNFIAKAAQATLVGDVFDDAATGQGLLNYFLRAINCGALSESEVESRTGLTRDELALRSFAKILAGRTART